MSRSEHVIDRKCEHPHGFVLRGIALVCPDCGHHDANLARDQAECPDCGAWHEAWEVNEHIARDHYGQVDEDE